MSLLACECGAIYSTVCASSVMCAAMHLCLATSISVVNVALCLSCGARKEPLCVFTCDCTKECVGLNGAGG